MIIIGDVAGQFEALMKLVGKFSHKEKFVLVGDLVDRGPQSKEVVEWAMKSDNVTTILGNHEHMFCDWYQKAMHDDYIPFDAYDGGIWLENGGIATIRSYDTTYGPFAMAAPKIPAQHILWMSQLPVSITIDHPTLKNLFISHAPWLQDAVNDFERIWSRLEPTPMPDTLQVFGHNSWWGKRSFRDETGKLWAQCIDQSKSDILTGYEPYGEEFIEVPYVEKKREIEL